MSQKWMRNHQRSRRQKPIGLGRLYGMLAVATCFVYVLIGLGSLLQKELPSTPLVMKKLTAQMSNAFLTDMLALETRVFAENQGNDTFTTNTIVQSFVRFWMHINPIDPKTILASEIAGIKTQSFDNWYDDTTVEDEQPLQNEDSSQVLTSETSDEGLDGNLSLIYEVVDNQHVLTLSEVSVTANEESVPASNTSQKLVFIYHSHPRESYLPELEDASLPSEANDDEINVRQLGARLSSRLNELGIGTINSEVDYVKTIEDYNWNFSYKYSLQTVKEAYAANPELEYFIDIHRDSQGREITTAEIDGVSYAKIGFVIGQENPNWRQNDALATKIQEKLEEKYPGISRGTWEKDRKSGHGEYNQSISPNSILIEVGGYENTFEECFRTIDAFAEVLASIVRDAQLVDSQQALPKEVL